jgi:fructose-1-phosphate kinase PfkB-like protein
MYRKTEFRCTRRNVRITHRGEATDIGAIREEVEFLVGHDILDELQNATESNEAVYLNHNYRLQIPREAYDKIIEKYQENN